MSSEDERATIEAEFEEAKETTRAYLRAVGVLAPAGVSMRQYRPQLVRTMRKAILNGGTEAVEAPNDPFARDAVILGIRHLHLGRDPGILDILREGTLRHPAYGEALTIIALRLKELDACMPDWLREWEPGSGNRKKRRWRREHARQHLIGMVVEAMATGSDVLIRYGESERVRVLLQRDLKAVADAAGKQLPPERVVEKLNEMKARPWRHRNGGKGLAVDDLVALTGKRSVEPAGIDAIVPDVKVRKHFPNLYATSGEATKDLGPAYSICDAVAEVLQHELPRRSRGERGRPWDRTVFRAWQEYRKWQGLGDA